MPNIEIHGFAENGASEMFSTIFRLFRDKSYVDKLVITIYPTKCYSRLAQPQPFIRLVSSCQTHNDEILDILKKLGVDIEYLRLEKFIPHTT